MVEAAHPSFSRPGRDVPYAQLRTHVPFISRPDSSCCREDKGSWFKTEVRRSLNTREWQRRSDAASRGERRCNFCLSFPPLFAFRILSSSDVYVRAMTSAALASDGECEGDASCILNAMQVRTQRRKSKLQAGGVKTHYLQALRPLVAFQRTTAY